MVTAAALGLAPFVFNKVFPQICMPLFLKTALECEHLLHIVLLRGVFTLIVSHHEAFQSQKTSSWDLPGS